MWEDGVYWGTKDGGEEQWSVARKTGLDEYIEGKMGKEAVLRLWRFRCVKTKETEK